MGIVQQTSRCAQAANLNCWGLERANRVIPGPATTDFGLIIVAKPIIVSGYKTHSQAQVAQGDNSVACMPRCQDAKPKLSRPSSWLVRAKRRKSLSDQVNTTKILPIFFLPTSSVISVGGTALKNTRFFFCSL